MRVMNFDLVKEKVKHIEHDIAQRLIEALYTAIPVAEVDNCLKGIKYIIESEFEEIFR